MNNLLSEIDKEFDEEFPNANHPLVKAVVGERFKSFLHQAVKRAYEEGAKDEKVRMVEWAKSKLEDSQISNGYYNAMHDLLSELNNLKQREDRKSL